MQIVRSAGVRSLLAALALALLAACSTTTVEPGSIERASIGSTAGELFASGLANPRGVTVAPDGAVLVAEAGVGGDEGCFDGPEGEACLGYSGAVTRIDRKGQRRVLEGLPSLAGPDGSFAGGVHDVSVLGNGNLYLTTGLGADPDMRDALFPDSGFGYLWRASQARGTVAAVADVADFERTDNPDGGAVDSNPYGVLAVPGGQVVVDAGGNSLLWIAADGSVETLAVFPSTMVAAPPFLELPPGTTIPMDAVPTSVARGPDGAYYVGQLTGFPFPMGGASVFRVVPGEAPTVYATGFTNIIDVTFDDRGALYVLELSTLGLLSNDLRGALKRVVGGTTETILGIDDGLVAPGGMAFGKRGELYVSNLSVFPDGMVLVFNP